MALDNYSTDGFVVSVNGRPLTDWGDVPTPYTDAPIDPKSTLRRGRGGRAIRIDRINPGREVTLTLNPGSPDSAYMQGLFNSNANITVTVQQVGTLEAFVGSEGVITNDGSVGRGAETLTDDVYIIQCNIWTALKGGNS